MDTNLHLCTHAVCKITFNLDFDVVLTCMFELTSEVLSKVLLQQLVNSSVHGYDPKALTQC